MTEQRKIQLATEVDASGSAAGFEQIKSGARDMAQAVSQAGQTAGKGLDAIGDGARRAADGFNREEGRMRSAIQRATLDLQTLGRAASEKLEAKINLQGLDPSKFQPYLAALRQLEEAQRSATQKQQSSAAADAFTDSLRGQIAALREQIKLQSMSADEVLRYKAAQAGAAESAAPLILQLRNMQAAQEAVAQAARDAAAAQKQAAVEAGRRSSFLEGLKQQSEAIGKTRADLLEMQAAQMGVASAAAPYIAKLREAEKGHQVYAAGAKLSAWQTQQLGFQLHDFAVQVMSGQNPLVAFAQQGSQLSGTFGGAGNAIRAVTSLITPMTIAIGGAAVAVGGLALAMSHAETAARGLAGVQAQLAGTGREGMFSDRELRGFITELSQAPGVTRETATAIISELSKVHEIGGGLFRDLARAAVDYAKATGTDVPTATRTLAKAFADPEKGARQLDEALGSLTSTQLLEIDRLTKLGDTAGAQRVLFDALQGSIKGLADNAMTPLQRSVNDLGNAWERALQAMDKSDALRTLNALLGHTVAAVTFLVNNVEKLGGLANIGRGSIPGALPSAAGEAIGGPIRRLIFGEEQPTGSRESSGRVTEQATSGSLAANQRAAGAKTAEDEIKSTLKATDGYRSQAQQLADLTATRERLNDSIKESIALHGKDSPVTKELQGRLSGVNERIAAAARKGAGGNEAQQVLDAQLQQRIKATQDALQQERDQLAFSQRFLQGVYQAGELSLVDFFDQKRKAIEQGAAAEIAALEKERADVTAHLEATKKTSPKDTSALVRDQTRLQEIDTQQAKIRREAAQANVLADQEQTATTRQLNEQVLTYRANLLQLQGDEAGAAKIRAQIAIEQARTLAVQSQKGANQITAADQAANQRAIEQTNEIGAARNRLTMASQALAIQEERISMLQRSGAVGELEALQQLGAARASRLASLEKEVAVIEKLAAERPLDLQLNLDASRARLELDSLKSQIDPLKDKFDGIFRDAGKSLFTDLASGKPMQALKNFGNNVARQISDSVADGLSAQTFGKNGAFGGAGGFFADLFGGKDRNKVQAAVDTSGVTQSLSSMKLAGVDPATDALARLTAAAEATAVSLRNVTGTDLPPLPGTTGDFARLDRAVSVPPRADGTGAAGDFARFDRGQTGEQAVMDQFRDASRSAEQLSASNAQAASSVVRLASAAANGGDAMAQLPAVIQSIIASANATAAASSGGGFLGGLASLFGSSGAGVNVSGMSGLSPETLALFGWSTGGYTGDTDPRKPAGIVHGKEYVFSEPAVRAIGVDRLERLHRKAKAGRMQDEEGIPGYADGGYVAVLGDRQQALRSSVQYLVPPQSQPAAKTEPPQVINHHRYEVTVQAAPGMSRATAMQRGAEVAQGAEMARRRQGKR